MGVWIGFDGLGNPREWKKRLGFQGKVQVTLFTYSTWGLAPIFMHLLHINLRDHNHTYINLLTHIHAISYDNNQPNYYLSVVFL